MNEAIDELVKDTEQHLDFASKNIAEAEAV